jgi:1-acyl-sn-glycerol-3-phosphate acyltransferase
MSAYLRGLIFLIGQSLSAILFCLLGLLFAFMPFSFRYRLITTWSFFVIWWAKVICGIHYRVSGLDNLPDIPSIVLCKHQSSWETLFLQTLLPPQSWVLKKELLSIPFFGWGLSLLEPIAIDRKKSRSVVQLLEQGKERLAKGRWVVIFPEGSRIAVGKTGKYSRSGAVLAKETNTPIVMIAHNAGRFWPRNAFIKHPGTVDVVISQPIDPTNYTIESLQEMIPAWIEETSSKL